MDRLLLLALLNAPLIDAFAFDDDDDTDDGDGDEDDAEKESKKSEKKSDDKPKPKRSETPESLKRQVRDLQKALEKKNRSTARLSRENKNLRLKSKGEKPKDEGADDGEDSDAATLRQTVQDLTERLDNISSENFIETKVVRKLQPLVAAGLEDDEAERKLNAALKLVDSDEDFDDDGNFDAEAFIKKYPFLAVEAKAEERGANRLLGGSGKKSQNKKNYAGEALARFNAQRNRNQGGKKT